jgi:hypothetical protein
MNAYHMPLFRGDMETVALLCHHGCPMDEDTCKTAAEVGNVTCLQLLHEHDCPWDETTFDAAVVSSDKYDNPECLRYAHAHGCPYRPEHRAAIARHVLLPKWRDLVQARGIVFYWLERTSRTTCADGGAGRKRDLEAFETDMKRRE